MDFGYWPETIERWHGEGLPEEIRSNSTVEDYLGLDRGYLPHRKSFNPEGEHNDLIYVEANWLDHFSDIYPPFSEEVHEERETTKILRSTWGVTMKVIKGAESMPQYLEHPVKNWEDFEAIKDRLDGRHPDRYPSDWEKKVEQYEASDQPLGLYVMGLFGSARELMGLEGLSYAYFDQPDLVKAIAKHQVEFIINAYDKVTADLAIDFVIIFEDMCYNKGPLISPRTFEEFMTPYYKQITTFFWNRGVRHILVDSDGNGISLIPLLMDVGVDGTVPCEINAGSDPLLFRKMYPNLRMMGGIDKMALIKGRGAIDTAIERLPGILEKGGFIPGVDHMVPPNVSYDNYRYFCDRRREFTEKYHP
jgi:uroporphyrinogen-III decarboxylase